MLPEDLSLVPGTQVKVEERTDATKLYDDFCAHQHIPHTHTIIIKLEKMENIH